ncbi:MAG: hypothetical protein C5B48_01640 [Candidatus Rokuibacteriota bacterium]|nr:MAG: hypothetical protein C5B48_01640 [Candidatus Rokubacteria bacterium]
MPREKVKLGGMALQNGVLVHSASAWACAVRTPEGRVKVAAERKRLRAAAVEQPVLRGPVRLLDALLLLPTVRRRLPEARLPFERPTVLGSMLASLVGIRLLRGSSRVSPATEELLGAILSLAPATLALRGGELAAYHGAEHVVIGSYEHGEPRPREHERCGTHLVGPLLLTSVLGAMLAARAPERIRGQARLLVSLASVAVATEIFGWMVRNPDRPLAQALSRPGYELQHRFATAEPTPEQLEVAEAALAACLELEHGD